VRERCERKNSNLNAQRENTIETERKEKDLNKYYKYNIKMIEKRK